MWESHWLRIPQRPGKLRVHVWWLGRAVAGSAYADLLILLFRVLVEWLCSPQWHEGSCHGAGHPSPFGVLCGR